MLPNFVPFWRPAYEISASKLCRFSWKCDQQTWPNKKTKLESGPMPNVMAAQPNIGGALCKSSIIPFLVPSRKVWLTHAAGVLCSLPGVKFTLCPSLAFCYTSSVTGSNAANIAYNTTQALDMKWILHWVKFHQGVKTPENAYIAYHPIRQPNIPQSLVGLRSATSLQ